VSDVPAGSFRPTSARDRIVVVGVDESDAAGDALALARLLAAPLDAAVLGVYVHPYGEAQSLLDNEKHSVVTRELAESVRSHMLALGFPVEDRTLRLVADRSPAGGLQRTAESTEAVLIVVGSSRRSRVGRVVPGGTAERLLTGAPCPVAVAPRAFAPHARGISTIGCAFDEREESGAALVWASELATATQSQLRLLAVHVPLPGGAGAVPVGVPLVSVNATLRQTLRSKLADAEDALRGATLSVDSMLLEGDAAEELRQQSSTLDLLVVGSRAYGPARAVLLGSVSSSLLRTAECPVIVVPRPGSRMVEDGIAMREDRD
jgi:nucleotide-binding universal stress UspA family protein